MAGGGLRCKLGFHAWDNITRREFIAGYGTKVWVVGYYCVRCDVEEFFAPPADKPW